MIYLTNTSILQNQIYQKFDNLIAKELSKLTVKVSLTADIWTSISNQAYFGINIQNRQKMVKTGTTMAILNYALCGKHINDGLILGQRKHGKRENLRYAQRRQGSGPMWNGLLD
nr:14335_t:CDS:2 [Entrophospora candida]